MYSVFRKSKVYDKIQQALKWNSQTQHGKHVKKKMKQQVHIQGTMKRLSKNHVRWEAALEAKCSQETIRYRSSKSSYFRICNNTISKQ